MQRFGRLLGLLEIELGERVGRIEERAPHGDAGKHFLRERERHVHAQGNFRARDVGPVVRGAGAGLNEVRIGDGPEDDGAIGDDLEGGLRRDRGQGGDLRHILLQELLHDERQRRDVPLRIPLEERDVDVLHVARIRHRLEESLPRFVHGLDRGDLYDANNGSVATFIPSACGGQEHRGDRTHTDQRKQPSRHGGTVAGRGRQAAGRGKPTERYLRCGPFARIFRR